MSVGPLPDDVDSLTFPAVQTYSSGEVVRWIEVSQPGQPEPERPAPTLTLVPADAGDEEAGASASTTTTAGSANGEAADEQASSAAGDDDDDGGSGNGLAIVALIIGAVGVLTGVGAIVMTRRR